VYSPELSRDNAGWIEIRLPRKLLFKGIYLVFLLVFAFLPKEALSKEDHVGRLTVIDGSVTIRKTGAEKVFSASVGDNIFVGDVLNTNKGSRAQIVLTDDSSVNMSSGTALRVNQYAFEIENNRRTAIVKLLEGKARFVVYKQRNIGSAFRVQTGHAEITAGSADFVAVVSPEETEVVVLDGGVSVKNVLYLTVGEIRVETNQKTVVKEKIQPSEPIVITSQQRRTYGKDAHHF